MSGINRTTILAGPALVTYGGQSFYSKGDVTLNFTPKSFAVTTAHFGEVDQRISDRIFEVSFEPVGTFTAALAALLWPYASTPMGASIYGITDRPLVIWTRDGQKLTLVNAAVTGMPNMHFGVGKTIQGAIKFTGLVANSTDPSNATAYYTLASATYPGDSGFLVSDIKTQAYSSTWGSSPWSSFFTEEGWDISFALNLKPQMVDGLGTVDMMLQGLAVTAKCVPVGVAAADILAKIAPDVALGNSIAALASNLVISGTGVYAQVNNAGMTDSGFSYGSEKKRIGPTTWKATRTITSGTPDPLFYIGTTAMS